MPPELELELREQTQPSGWMLIDQRTRMFSCPWGCGCAVPDLERAVHQEWHEKHDV